MLSGDKRVILPTVIYNIQKRVKHSMQERVDT